MTLNNVSLANVKISFLFIIEAILFAAFWLLLIGGEIQEFETIEFFEPAFTYILIVVSICTGMLIGSFVERYNNSKKESP